MLRAVAILVGAVALMWGLLVPAFALGRDNRHWLAGSLAAGICIVPTTITLILMMTLGNRSPQERLIAALLGTGFRLAGVFFGGVGAYFLLAEVREKPYWFFSWLLVFYLLTLIVETILVLRSFRPPQVPTAKENSTRGDG